MTDSEALDLLASMLREIAPGVDLQEVDQEANLQDELDLDSVDFLRLMEMIHERTGASVPETDYEKLSSVRRCVAYLCATAP